MTVFTKPLGSSRILAMLVAGTLSSACMSWRTQSLEPARFQSGDSTRWIRLTLTSGDTLFVRGPVLAGDSLVGVRPVSTDSTRRVSIPLAAIRRAEMRKANVLGTVVAVWFLGSAVVFVLAEMVTGGSGSAALAALPGP